MNNLTSIFPQLIRLLVEKVPITPREENRYDLHKICAETGRHILLDLEVLTEIEIKDQVKQGLLQHGLI